jgi:hypothetical protein
MALKLRHKKWFCLHQSQFLHKEFFMKKMFSLLMLAILLMSSPVWAQCVLGVEANGGDQATMEACKWRVANVYSMYEAKGFKVVLIDKSSKSKVDAALNVALDRKQVTHLTGCGHGNTNVYTGYNQATVFISSDTTLLKKLAGVHVHLLSCLTAQKLGPDMIKQGAASYAGYHPSFYFTWKSTARFFDADAEMDRVFADGLTASQGYQRTINKFNEILKILETEEPDAVQYIVIDRDGLRCMPARAEEDADFSLPLELASRTLYARNPTSGEFVSFAEFQNNAGRAVAYTSLSDEEVKDLAVAKFSKMDRNFELCILSVGRFHRDRIIEEIKRNSELGQMFVAGEKEFLARLNENRWSKTITLRTDANGAITAADKFDVPMTITVKGVKAAWKGTPSSFSNATFALNGEGLFNGVVANGTTYAVKKKLNSGPCQYNLNAVGGPKDTDITVTITYDLGK